MELKRVSIFFNMIKMKFTEPNLASGRGTVSFIKNVEMNESVNFSELHQNPPANGGHLTNAVISIIRSAFTKQCQFKQ